MKVKLKVILTLVVALCLTFSINPSVSVSAANIQENTSITPMYVPCPNCGTGQLFTHIEYYGPYLIGSHVCPTRMDCLVTEYRTDRVEVTSCSSCAYGYTTQLSPTYSESHSIWHN